ncbi:DsbA family oxidoreductase [Pseudomonas entomophila]|uniref:DsbA family oxidoreductase n=1 Tax=Pseudomonas entomophila TaxID=312306 RepID=UPI0023D7F626|nr:DsbA family oxidoreductase [Pseudomonas entomophila]MDF0729553.1 DsbA family oxidoreductase [Pseudomonas entomophila]
MTATVKVDFVSDVVCPWCALGIAALEQAIVNLAGEVAVELTYKPFELNPGMGPEGEPAIAHMMRKYGRTAEQVAERNALIVALGEQVGFAFDLGKRSHFRNTFAAHRLLYWAAQEGRQRELKRVLLRGYFIEGENPDDHDALVRLASEAGLEAEAARQVLVSGAFADEVRQLDRFYQVRGVQSVPAMVINGRHVVSGSQSVAYYEQALRQAGQ